MNNLWLLYTGLTVTYIIILVAYFLRRTKSHENQLQEFLMTAKKQVDLHKREVNRKANFKIHQAAQVVKKIQSATEVFETEVQKEYEKIIEDAKSERREIIAQAKTEIQELFEQADHELEEYRQARQQEIERNLVKMVLSVTEKVVEVSLDDKQHKEIIYKALDEVKASKKRQ